MKTSGLLRSPTSMQIARNTFLNFTLKTICMIAIFSFFSQNEISTAYNTVSASVRFDNMY